MYASIPEWAGRVHLLGGERGESAVLAACLQGSARRDRFRPDRQLNLVTDDFCPRELVPGDALASAACAPGETWTPATAGFDARGGLPSGWSWERPGGPS